MKRIMKHNKRAILQLIACLAILLVGLVVIPQSTSAQQRTPPPEAITACETRSTGDTCQIRTPDGATLTGVCRQLPDETEACVPTDAPVAAAATPAPADTAPAPASAPATNDTNDTPAVAVAGGYPVVDTGQTSCYNNMTQIACPSAGETWYGQDAQHTGTYQPSYTDNGDGTITDNVTGLMWQQGYSGKMTYDEAVAGADSFNLGGYTDWRLPTVKELYSLMNFNGTDPSGYEGTDTSQLIPFIDTNYFDFVYGDTTTGDRIIDAQYASSTLYVGPTVGSDRMMFGVNFADGRIKGYALTLRGVDKTFFVKYVRGNTAYGVNDLVDQGNGTVVDQATGLMWAQNDSGTGMDWATALAWVEQKNAEGYLGYTDWRLPNAKELQSIVDYTRSPGTTGTAAIDPVFNATSIINEAGETDYPYYWTSTNHVNYNGVSEKASFVAFGRAMGYVMNAWQDVHGAGAQRSDFKSGNPASYPEGHGPQGGAVRINNAVRLVRDADVTEPAPTDTPDPNDGSDGHTPSMEGLDVYLPLVKH